LVPVILCFAVSAALADNQRQLRCTGPIIESTALAQSPKTIKLSLDPARKVTVDLGQGPSDARVISDNGILLRFRAKQFDGEYFRYTDELFLIYHSGHLARLTCRNAAD
jgi:hypothetical protein